MARVDAACRSTTDGGELTLGDETIDQGLTNAVKDNDSQFPPDWRLSKSGRRANQ